MLPAGEVEVARRLARRSRRARSGCVVWRGAVQSRGYGCMSVGGKKTALAHRVAYFLAHGEIDAALTIKLCPDQAQSLAADITDAERAYAASTPTLGDEIATCGRLLVSAGRALLAQYGGQRHAPTRPTDPEGCPVCGTHGEHSVNCPAGAVR